MTDLMTIDSRSPNANFNGGWSGMCGTSRMCRQLRGDDGSRKGSTARVEPRSLMDASKKYRSSENLIHAVCTRLVCRSKIADPSSGRLLNMNPLNLPLKPHRISRSRITTAPDRVSMASTMAVPRSGLQLWG